MGKASVIIVNWNGARFIERCLTALMAQTVQPHEIILVDNASTDDSVAIVRRFLEVRLMQLPRNEGFARGNNLAIASVAEDSEWIVLLNPDAFADPRWLEELLAAAGRNPGFDVFGSKLVNAGDPVLLDGEGDAYHASGLVWRTGHGKPLRTNSETEREIFSPCAAAAMYRRTSLAQVGGFDEDYFCYVEDVDLGFRLRLAGSRSLYVPHSVVHHVGSGTTGGGNSDFSTYYGHRNLVWTFVKDMPGVLFWILLPLHILMNLVSLIWISCRGQSEVILKAKLDALRGLPKMWSKRKEIQMRRTVPISEIWARLDKKIGWR